MDNLFRMWSVIGMGPGRLDPDRVVTIHCFLEFRQSEAAKKPGEPEKTATRAWLFQVFAGKASSGPVKVVNELRTVFEWRIQSVVQGEFAMPIDEE